jgi:hypothetical protein
MPVSMAKPLVGDGLWERVGVGRWGRSLAGGDEVGAAWLERGSAGAGVAAWGGGAATESGRVAALERGTGGRAVRAIGRWGRGVVDAPVVGGERPAPRPLRSAGRAPSATSKRHLICDGQGIRLAVI